MLSADRVRMQTLEQGVVAVMLDGGLVIAEGQFIGPPRGASTMVFERMP